MTLNPEDSRPVSQQIAELLRDEIACGTPAPGQRVESVRSLAKRFGVSPQAANNALDILKGDGLIYTSPGRGSFVRASPTGTATAQADELTDLRNQVAVLNARLEAVANYAATAAVLNEPEMAPYRAAAVKLVQHMMDAERLNSPPPGWVEEMMKVSDDVLREYQARKSVKPTEEQA